MKKRIIYLFSFVFLFIISISSVKADINNYIYVDADDISEDTYVIGTHIFNRESNSDYNGILYTKFIMLAAKTIKDDSLNKMIIYYKNIDEEWVDAFTGEAIKTPKVFLIEYVNARPLLQTPSLFRLDFAGIGGWSGDTQDYSSNTFGLGYTNSNKVETGIEIYCSEKEDSNYSFLKKIENVSDMGDIYVDLSKGTQSFYKIRFYKSYDDEIIYSEFSDPVLIENLYIELRKNLREIDSDGLYHYEFHVDTIGDADYALLYKFNGDEGTRYTKDQVYNGEMAISESGEVLRDTPYYVYLESYREDGAFVSSSNSIELSASENANLSYSFNYVDDFFQPSRYNYSLFIENIPYNSNVKAMCSWDGDDYTECATSSDNYMQVSLEEGDEMYVKGQVLKDGNIAIETQPVIINAGPVRPSQLEVSTTYKYDNKLEKDVLYDVVGVEYYPGAGTLEIYRSNSVDGNYVLVNGDVYNDYYLNSDVNTFLFKNENEETRFYKVRTYIDNNGTKMYSSFYGPVGITLESGIEISYVDIRQGGLYMDDEVQNYILYDYQVEVNNTNFSGIETYVYDMNNVLVESNTWDGLDEKHIFLPEGEYNIKARKFYTYENKTSYGEWYEVTVDTDDTFGIYKSYLRSNDTGSIYKIELGEFKYAHNVELYKSVNNSEFEKVQTVLFEDLIVDEKGYYSLDVVVPKGEIAKYYVKLTDGFSTTKASNTVECGSSLEKSEMFAGGLYGYRKTSKSLYLVSPMGNINESSDGYELYGSDELNGEYVKLLTVDFNDDDGVIKLPFESVRKYFKVREYTKYNDEYIYSEFSDAVELFIDEPCLEVELLGSSAPSLENPDPGDLYEIKTTSEFDVEYWVSNTKNGEYTKLDEISQRFTYEAKGVVYIKVRAKVTVGDKVYYSKYVNSQLGYLIGDINGDGVVNNQDATLLNSYLDGNEEFDYYEFISADLNIDDNVDDTDYNIMISYLNGNITSLPYID